ncbi:Methionyl-tRNA formyltransferase [Nitrospina gracilis 3/211]|uniref:Methionyl-tRNA formyltransferase n=1 Tax=Nitrospina gracilis (strain 3/211) TaxID=1266370 RepID=M1YVT7_NITG3|nr:MULTISPECIES: methionyl-tRNA formyltransferase [Nitrospina]MCF8722647.1 methionyl-tRNA formyltransferase [Nitrospina sp. Nb-3]CCQ89582.1 Methionyl-tRNA formyltransferase [Nitrospina gracilis 3/211]
MNLVFLGTPDFAVPTLKALHASRHTVQAVVTQPDRPKGRGRAAQPPPVKEFALAHGLDVLQPTKASAPDFVEQLRPMKPDLIVVIAYGQLLKPNFLELPKHFCMNIHASILPKYRGAAPINWAIINGETETGVTTMKIDPGLDSGDMLLIRKVPIGPDDTAQDLHDALADAGAKLALESIDQLEAGTLPIAPQDHDEATFARKLKKEDGFICWTQSAQRLHDLVRGLNPWPGAYTFLNGHRLKLYKTETAPRQQKDEAGRVMRVTKHGIEVATSDDRLILTELQPEGKKKMNAQDFLAGHDVQIGDRFESAPQPIQSD